MARTAPACSGGPQPACRLHGASPGLWQAASWTDHSTGPAAEPCALMLQDVRDPVFPPSPHRRPDLQAGGLHRAERPCALVSCAVGAYHRRTSDGGSYSPLCTRPRGASWSSQESAEPASNLEQQLQCGSAAHPASGPTLCCSLPPGSCLGASWRTLRSQQRSMEQQQNVAVVSGP